MNEGWTRVLIVSQIRAVPTRRRGEEVHGSCRYSYVSFAYTLIFGNAGDHHRKSLADPRRHSK